MNVPVADPAEELPGAGVAAGRLVRSSAVVGLGTALSRVTGFLRVVALASIGFGRLTDVYNIANSTPNIVYELLLGGVLTATLVPLYVEQVDGGDDDATDAVNSFAIAGLVAVTLLGLLASPWIIRLYTLRLDAADRALQQELAVALLRLFMPQILFYGLTAVMTSMLNARRRYAAAAFAPVLNNVVVIGVLLALPRAVHGRLSVASVHGDTGAVLLLGLGTTAGIVAMTVALLPALRASGGRLRLTARWRHPAVSKLLRLSGWTFGYVAANQVALWFAIFLAYGRGGDASVYLAAFTFFQLPHGLFAVSLMTTFTPELARAAQAGDAVSMERHLVAGLRLVGLVMLPASAALVALAGPIVTAFLRYGHLSAASADLTASTLTWFGVGLFAFSAYLFVLRGFYALQDTRTPCLVNLLENGLNVVLAVVLWPLLGVRGLALAWSLAYVASAVIAGGALRRRIGRLGGPALVSSFLRVGVGSVAFGATAAAVAAVVGWGTTPRALLALAAAGAAGAVAFVVVARVSHVEEAAMLRDAITRRRARRGGSADAPGPARAAR